MSAAYNKWKNTKPYGKQIEGTRIIAFKTPQNKHSNNGPDESFNVNDLIQNIPNLGLVIDLTYTTKYYKPETLLAKGINYIKIFIEGKRVPPLMYLVKFCRIVDDFLDRNNNDKLIGIHCTHGINRTGYMICSYMIKCMGMEPREAIKRFQSARGTLIENYNYLNELSLLRPSYKIIDKIEGDALIRKLPKGSVISRTANDKKVSLKQDFNLSKSYNRTSIERVQNSPREINQHREINNRSPYRDTRNGDRHSRRTHAEPHHHHPYSQQEFQSNHRRIQHGPSVVDNHHTYANHSMRVPQASTSNYTRRVESSRPYNPTLTFAAVVARNNENNTASRSVNNYRMPPPNMISRNDSFVRTERYNDRTHMPTRTDDHFKSWRNESVNVPQPRRYETKRSRSPEIRYNSPNRNSFVRAKRYNDRAHRPIRTDDDFKSWRNESVNVPQPRRYDTKRTRSPDRRDNYSPGNYRIPKKRNI